MSKKPDPEESIAPHEEGFVKEAKLRSLHAEVSQRQEALYPWDRFMEAARLINPELCAGAFARKPCRRKLRYIGGDSWPEPTRSEMNAAGHDYFVHGEIYYSTDFNGSTYSIEGGTDRDNARGTGCAYFEWLKE